MAEPRALIYAAPMPFPYFHPPHGFSRWSSAPAGLRAARWFVGGCLVFSLLAVAVKAAGRGLATFEIAFFRSLFGLLTVLPFLKQEDLGALIPPRLHLHAMRGMLSAMAMFCVFYAMVHLSVAAATALSFSTPLFAAPLAGLWLREQVGWRRAMAVVVGFCGVVVMAHPAGTFEAAAGVAVLAAMLVAVVSILVKQLAMRESPASILLMFGLITTLLYLPPTLWNWRDPSPVEWTLLVAAGITGTIGQFMLIRAYRLADASALVPLDYTRLIFATILGFLLFDEIPDGWTLAGAAIIMTSTFAIARAEAKTL